MTSPKGVFVVALLVVVVVAAAYAAGVPSNSITLFAVASVFSAWHGRRARRRRDAFQSIIRELRAADRETRARMLHDLEPRALRDAVAQVLGRDGSEESDAGVERFPYPEGLRRFIARKYWILWGATTLLLLIGAFSDAWMSLRLLSLAVAGACGYGAWKTARREAGLQSVIEVTPFRVSELLPGGDRTTLLFGRYLELRDEPAKQRMLITGGSDDTGIALDYRRMGFDRLVELVLLHGGFHQSAAGEEPATPEAT